MCWGGLAVTLWDWDSGNYHKNAKSLATAPATSNKLSVTSDPGVSCVLSASTKQQKVNMLVCKYGEVSDSSQFLT